VSAMVGGDVLIIGGGVVGMAAAYELSGSGVSVTVVDRGEPGFGCSYGNAGWITPSLARPLPSPGMLGKALRWMLDPDSPLYIQPRMNASLARWLLRFLRSMNAAHMNRAIDALTGLTRHSLDVYAGLDAETGHATGFRRDGLLVAASTDAGREDALGLREIASRRGVPGHPLDPAELRELEPAVTGRIAGGVFFPQEAHAEPLELVRAFAKGAKNRGARILSDHEVFAFRTEGRRVLSLETTRGVLSAGSYVLATGSWSRALSRKLGIEIPVLGGKGYALTLPPLEPMPRRPLMLIEKKIAVTPRDGSIRIGGTLELVDQDESITARRVAAIVRGARGYLTLPEDPRVLELWRGLRPCTPDGLPLIDRSPRHDNLVIATGHQMLGVQSAPGTARLVADLVLRRDPSFDPAPFRASRF